MALHKTIQQLLLIGARLPVPAPRPVKPQPPAALVPIIAAVTPIHDAFNGRAIDFGHRYRSAFWAIYILSAIAVLFAVMPLALGWDDEHNAFNHYSAIWVVAEILVIMLVGLIYWRGHQQDWQGQWLGARTKAEMTWYLPLIAPLIDANDAADAGSVSADSANWYAQLFSSKQPGHADADISTVCRTLAPLVRSSLLDAWADPQFVTSYAQWTVDMLEGQRHYHQHVAHHQHALLHRVHAINTWLFGLTGLAALAHLFIHSKVLTMMATFFPALGASLHGALAQSEAYRLESTSLRLVEELGKLIAGIRETRRVIDPVQSGEALRTAILSAVSLILDEHQDWHMLVRPHHLPLG